MAHVCRSVQRSVGRLVGRSLFHKRAEILLFDSPSPFGAFVIGWMLCIKFKTCKQKFVLTILVCSYNL